eukprot:GHVP01033310.1.p1 GENE.GHVP01033310.1~~GHVP01033310.1.p1  ORF type:complete len:149 (+),score=20.80 GHVP01033310.1:132-578(+)
MKTCIQNHQKMVNCKKTQDVILLANAHFEVNNKKLVVTFNCFGTASLTFVTDHEAGNNHQTIGSYLNGITFLPRKLENIQDNDLPLPQVEIKYNCNKFDPVEIFITVFVRNQYEKIVGASMKIKKKVAAIDTTKKHLKKSLDTSNFES